MFKNVRLFAVAIALVLCQSCHLATAQQLGSSWWVTPGTTNRPELFKNWASGSQTTTASIRLGYSGNYGDDCEVRCVLRLFDGNTYTYSADYDVTMDSLEYANFFMTITDGGTATSACIQLYYKPSGWQEWSWAADYCFYNVTAYEPTDPVVYKGDASSCVSFFNRNGDNQAFVQLYYGTEAPSIAGNCYIYFYTPKLDWQGYPDINVGTFNTLASATLYERACKQEVKVTSVFGEMDSLLHPSVSQLDVKAVIKQYNGGWTELYSTWFTIPVIDN